MNEDKEYFECPACDQLAAHVEDGATGYTKHGTEVEVFLNKCDSCGHVWWD